VPTPSDLAPFLVQPLSSLLADATDHVPLTENAGKSGAVIERVSIDGERYVVKYLDRRHDWMNLLWMGIVAICVVAYAFWIHRFSREHPWKWLVLLFMALGLLAIALIAPADFVGLWRPMLLFVGLAWIGSGAATLYLYIRHTQAPAPETE